MLKDRTAEADRTGSAKGTAPAAAIATTTPAAVAEGSAVLPVDAQSSERQFRCDTNPEARKAIKSLLDTYLLGVDALNNIAPAIDNDEGGGGGTRRVDKGIERTSGASEDGSLMSETDIFTLLFPNSRWDLYMEMHEPPVDDLIGGGSTLSTTNADGGDGGGGGSCTENTQKTKLSWIDWFDNLSRDKAALEDCMRSF